MSSDDERLSLQNFCLSGDRVGGDSRQSSDGGGRGLVDGSVFDDDEQFDSCFVSFADDVGCDAQGCSDFDGIEGRILEGFDLDEEFLVGGEGSFNVVERENGGSGDDASFSLAFQKIDSCDQAVDIRDDGVVGERPPLRCESERALSRALSQRSELPLVSVVGSLPLDTQVVNAAFGYVDDGGFDLDEARARIQLCDEAAIIVVARAVVVDDDGVLTRIGKDQGRSAFADRKRLSRSLRCRCRVGRRCGGRVCRSRQDSELFDLLQAA